MIIEDFALVLRRRGPWEALDLGIVIARRWRRPALLAWLSTYAVTGLVACCTLGLWDWRLAWLLIWWSKPLFDRVLLHVYSQAVFGAVPTLGETLLATRGFLLSGQLWSDLTLRRFSPVRSFVLPVAVLEGQRGRKRAARVAVLGRSTEGCATWLTLACSNFVLLASLTVIAAVATLAPVGVVMTGWLQAGLAGQATQPFQAFGAIVLMMVCETLIEPLYVASGFSLYLNRRSELEGWDLELAFRRMQRRLTQLPKVTPLMILLLFVFAQAAGAPGLARAANTDPTPAKPPPPRVVEAAAQPMRPSSARADLAPAPGGPVEAIEAVRARARQVLADPVFGHDQTEWSWQLRSEPEDAQSHRFPEWFATLFRLIQQLLNALAFLAGWGVRLVLGVLLGVLVVLAAVWLVRHRRALSASERGVAPARLFGLDVRREGLPDDVSAAARRLIEEGAFAAALGLLYRACLIALIHRAHIPFQNGDTEARCLERAAAHLDPGRLAYFRSLVDAWRLTAYAHRPPAPDRLVELAADWPRHFGPNVALESARS